MPNPLLAKYPAAADPVARHGYVLEPPAALGGAMTVQVPHFDASGAHVFEVRHWSARGLTIPAEGDEVLLIVDDVEDAWAVSWWPAAGDVALGREHPFDFGVVTALPTKNPTPAAGDRCTFKIEAALMWDLVYTGEATYPWVRVGGPPLISTIYTEQQRTFAGYDGTGCPILTVPLAMEFRAVVEDSYTKLTTAPGGADGTLRAIYIAGVQKIAWQVNIGEPLFGGGQSVQRTTLTMTKGQSIQSAYAVALGNKIGYANMTLIVDPIRVG